MSFASADVNKFYIHGTKSLTARAVDMDDSSWLRIVTDDERVTLIIFMPIETARLYASAINTCNREVTNAREDTHTDA